MANNWTVIRVYFYSMNFLLSQMLIHSFCFCSSSSRSKSRSKSPPQRRRKKYITSFGGNDDSDDGDGVVQGPALPPGFSGSDSTNTKPSATWSVLLSYLVSPATKGITWLDKPPDLAVAMFWKQFHNWIEQT